MMAATCPITLAGALAQGNAEMLSGVVLAQLVNPDVVGPSALVSTTLKSQKDTIEAIEKASLRDKVRVIIGGAAVTEKWARSIGADAWATDATVGIRKIKNLIQH